MISQSTGSCLRATSTWFGEEDSYSWQRQLLWVTTFVNLCESPFLSTFVSHHFYQLLWVTTFVNLCESQLFGMVLILVLNWWIWSVSLFEIMMQHCESVGVLSHLVKNHKDRIKAGFLYHVKSLSQENGLKSFNSILIVWLWSEWVSLIKVNLKCLFGHWLS